MKKIILIVSFLFINLYANNTQKGIDAFYNHNYIQSKKYLTKACDSRDGKGCHFLGLFYDNGEAGVRRDLQKAQKYFVKACNYGYKKGCYLLSVTIKDRDNNINYNKARKIFNIDCKNGNSKACTILGIIYVLGNGVDKNYKIASKYFKKSCRLGDKEACAMFNR